RTHPSFCRAVGRHLRGRIGIRLDPLLPLLIPLTRHAPQAAAMNTPQMHGVTECHRMLIDVDPQTGKVTSELLRQQVVIVQYRIREQPLGSRGARRSSSQLLQLADDSTGPAAGTPPGPLGSIIPKTFESRWFRLWVFWVILFGLP